EGSADTFLRVFDANGNELAYHANASPETIGSEVQISLTAGQTYYIGVNGASAQARSYNPLTGAGAAPGSTGNYMLSVTSAATAAVTTTTLSVSASSITIGQPVSLTATVSSASGTPSGSVVFSDGTAPIGTVPLANGTAVLSTWVSGIGTHSITAAYQGDANFASSTSSPQTLTVSP